MPPILITLPDKNGRQWILQLFPGDFHLYLLLGQWDSTSDRFFPSDKLVGMGYTLEQLDKLTAYVRARMMK